MNPTMRIGAVLFGILLVWSIADGQSRWVSVFFFGVVAACLVVDSIQRNVELQRRGPVCFHCDQPLPKDHDPECEECGDRGCID